MVGNRSKASYIPKYIAQGGKITKMKKNSARFVIVAGITVLEFNAESEKAFMIRLGNDMRRNNIYDLRAAIYQTGEYDPELKRVKEQMIAELENAEKKLLKDYLKTAAECHEFP